MAKLFWYARQMDSCTSKQSSRQCQDRWSSLQAAHCRALALLGWEADWRGKKTFDIHPSFYTEFPLIQRNTRDRRRRITIMNSRYQSSVYEIPRDCFLAAGLGGGRKGTPAAALVSDRRNRAKTIIYDAHVILLLPFLFYTVSI